MAAVDAPTPIPAGPDAAAVTPGAASALASGTPLGAVPGTPSGVGPGQALDGVKCMRVPAAMAARGAMAPGSVSSASSTPLGSVPGTPSGAGPGQALDGVKCMRCLELVSFSDSAASGRNIMKRICRYCGATDKSIQRCKDASVKKNFNLMTPAEKTEYFVREKAKRKKDEFRQKRDFSDLMVAQKDVQAVGSEQLDLDKYEVFEDWCVRQMVLKKYNSVDECATAWQLLAEDPSQNWVFARGQWCLGRFAGVQRRRYERNEQQREISQSRAVGSASEFEAVLQRCDETLAKRRRINDTEAPVFLASVQPPIIDEGDIFNAQSLEDLRPGNKIYRRDVEKELHRQVREQQDAEKEMVAELATKDEAGDAGGVGGGGNKAKVQSTALNMLALQSSLGMWTGKLDVALLKLSSQATLYMEEVTKNLGCSDPSLLKEAGDKHQLFLAAHDEANKRGSKCKLDMAAQVNSASTADEVQAAQTFLKETVVKFQVAAGPLKDTRERLKDLKSFATKVEKHIKKIREQQAKTHNKKRRCDQNAAEHPTWPLTKEISEKLADGVENVNAKNVIGQLKSAVLLPAERFAESFVAPLMKEQYYIEQKKWVFKHIVEQQLRYTAADIMRESVLAKIRSRLTPLLDEKLFGIISREPGEDWLEKAFAFQFFLALPNMHEITTTPLCLGEVRVVMEGQLTLCGVALDRCPGEGMRNKIDQLGSLTLSAFTELAKTAGFFISATAGQAIVVPPGYMIVEVTPANDISKLESCTSGLRWSFMPSDDAVALAALRENLRDMLESWPSLQGTDFGKLASKVDALVTEGLK